MDRILKESSHKVGIRAKDKIIIAVSGGVDSVVLLDLAAKNLPPENLIVAHVNHGLRKESHKEELLVSKLAQKYGLAFESTKLNLIKASEEVSRNKRYQYLHKIKDKHGALFIAVAHHLNDQAETVLLKLTRGTGPLGIWGMKELEEDIWRPLLSVPKRQIETFAKQRKLIHVIDKSNLDTKYARNRIRLNVIPELLKLNPNFLETLRDDIQLGQELEIFVNKKIQTIKKRLITDKRINLKKLSALDIFSQKQVIFDALKSFTPRASGIYQKNVAEILKIAKAQGNNVTKIAGFTIAKNYDRIIFDLSSKRSQNKKVMRLGDNHFNGWVLSVKKVKVGRPSKDNVFLPLNMLKNLEVRAWEAGDKIKSRAGTKKLQDIFTDKKISPDKRKLWPLITAGGEIVWVPNLQASDKAIKSFGKNKLIIEVKIEKKL